MKHSLPDGRQFKRVNMGKKSKIKWENVNDSGFILTGFVKADNAILREITIRTNPQTALLYLILLSHRNTETNQCYPSKSLLAREMGLSERTIGNMLTDLYEIGAVDINSGRKGYSNCYYFPAEDFYKKFKKDSYQSQARRRIGKFKEKPTYDRPRYHSFEDTNEEEDLYKPEYQFDYENF